MKTCTILPVGYEAVISVDMQKDRRFALRINGLAGGLMLLLLLLGHFLIQPITGLFATEVDSLAEFLMRPIVLVVGLILYLILHELTHAAVMKCFGAKRVRFGFTGLYAFAGSEVDYFGKRAYLLTSLAPLILFGILFTVPLIVGPSDWFWIFYLLQISNISGSAGDLYIAFRTAGMKDTVLIRDTGTSMTFYQPAGAADRNNEENGRNAV